MESIIAVMGFVFIMLFAAVVRVLGTGSGYKVLFFIIAFFILLKTYR